MPVLAALLPGIGRICVLLGVIVNGGGFGRVLNVDRSTVKHGLQNIQNECHQWLSDSFSAPNSFSARAPPRIPLGSLQRSPNPLAGLRGTYF